MKSLLDKSFKYTPAIETDLRKTFARIERERKAEAAAREAERAAAHARAHPEERARVVQRKA